MSSAIDRSGLSQDEIDRFQADGFLLVEDFFTHEELDRFGKLVDAAVRYRTADDRRALSDKNLYEQTFVQCMRLWEDHPSISPFTFHPKLGAASAALLQTERVRLWHDQALYKEAGGRKTDAHLDYPFWPVDKPDLVSVWIPFDDVRPGGGMMSYVQGSHTMGITQFVDIGDLRGGESIDLLQTPEVASRPLIPVSASKGSAIFHHACTIHAADANETDSVRRVFTMVYMADGCRRSRDDVYFALDRDEIKTGDLIVGPGHPIAWPRPKDDLPSSPTVMGPKTGFGFSDSDEA
ncbi:MAG: phytanoyl-CoA dioxygenase family protein [Gammaproteobacteria bacterium]|nr:phytanoyl-CoA dioxygenase family protein [Gammaproteobacteria bacterium]MDH3414853.1 phytanoyl-CoA dioxygenase family protein [Gammaproteobacteria bacterium]